jgi:acyl-CoA reductase-like NAD-dependent aldehyde dehydrogenase
MTGASDTPEPRRITVKSPIDGKTVGELVVTDPRDVQDVVDRARVAFERWSVLTHRDRRPSLRAFTGAVLSNMDRIASMISAETGKNHGEALAEVTAALTAMDFYTRNTEKMLATRKGKSWPFVTTRGWTEYHPRGVAGVISPWNYPFYLPMLSTIQALAAGCTVVLKPSEVAPHSGALIGELAIEAGLQTDTVAVIHGFADTGAALVESRVDIVAFTGSTEIGKKIAMEAAQSLKPTVLELGGNDAMIVLDDANVKNAARAAVTFGVINAGQTCVGVERVYVDDAVYDEFMAVALATMNRLSISDGGSGDIGPVVTAEQVKIVEDQVADAVAKGAEILCGGNRIDTDHGVYYEPTLIAGVDHSMDIMRDETFGPVVPVMRVPDEKTALHFANDSRYGLHGSVWTSDRSRGRWVASQLDTGTVAINDHLINFFYPSIPLGGTKDSGTGAVLGEEGVKNYCIHRSITEARFAPSTRLLGSWLPRKVGPSWWHLLAKALFSWRR